MTVREAWVTGVAVLKAAAIPTGTPELDARVLLGHLLGTDLAGLLARYPDPLSPALEAPWREVLARRGNGTPVAWLVGKQEFMGLDFVVGEGVLVPRADTETLVEAALALLPSLPGDQPLAVADVCAGSGCVGLSLAVLATQVLGRERAFHLTAIELSPEALVWTQENAKRLLPGNRPTATATVEVVPGDLLSGCSGPFDLIVSNPPYLSPEETRHRKDNLGWQEPALALNGGPGGWELPFRLIEQAWSRLKPGGWLLLEAADAQMETLGVRFADEGFAGVRFWSDLSGQRRVVGGQYR